MNRLPEEPSPQADGTEFPARAYLQRIGLAVAPAADQAGLTRLHRAQIYAVPFENFDIQLGRPLDLSPAGLIRKLVTDRRGGYCFELNGLFLQALDHFGFSARPLLARVHLGGEPSGRTHQISLVRVDGRNWIADVGFGGNSLRSPMPLEPGLPWDQDGRPYRLVDREPFGLMLQMQQEDGWLDLYSFDLSHVTPADILIGNHFTETHPRSHFTTTRVAALARPTGRVALHNFTLREVTNDRTVVTELSPGPAYLEALRRHFGIRLPSPYAALKPVVA